MAIPSITEDGYEVWTADGYQVYTPDNIVIPSEMGVDFPITIRVSQTIRRVRVDQ